MAVLMDGSASRPLSHAAHGEWLRDAFGRRSCFAFEIYIRSCAPLRRFKWAVNPMILTVYDICDDALQMTNPTTEYPMFTRNCLTLVGLIDAHTLHFACMGNKCVVKAGGVVSALRRESAPSQRYMAFSPVVVGYRLLTGFGGILGAWSLGHESSVRRGRETQSRA